MKILIWMCGHTRRHKIKNKFIQDNVVLTFVVDKIMEARLRWSGYMTKRCVNKLVRRCERPAVEGLRRSRGRPKKN